MGGTIGVAVSDASNHGVRFQGSSRLAYALGIGVGAGVTGALATALGLLVPPLLAYVAVVFAVGLWAFELIGVVAPPRLINRQVPVALLTKGSVRLTAMRWGIELGTGWLTRINTWAVVAMIAVLATHQRWQFAALVVSIYALTKALPGVLGWRPRRVTFLRRF